MRGERGDGAPETAIDELRAELARYRAFFDDNPHAAFSLTTDGYFAAANATTEERVGYSREELALLRFDEIVHDDRLPQAFATFAAVLAGDAQKVHTVVRTRDGRRVDLNVTLVPVVVDGEVVAVQGLAEDMTEENTVLAALVEARRDAESAAEAKTDFLRNTSHEFRTPLTSLQAAAELLAETDLDAEQRRLLGVVQRAGARLGGLVENVLDASLLSTGRVSLRVDPLRVADVLASVERWATPEARRRGIGFRHDVSVEVPATLHGDARRLEQVLTHLVGNALKFTDSGAVTLRVTRVTDESAGDRVCFEVEDTGSGFPQVEHDALFEPFAQLDSTTTRRHDGAGLGLSISRDIVALMGGRLTATSVLGAGSTFRLLLPLACPLAARDHG